MLKYSRQREAIKRFLMTRTDHPTADTVYVNIKKDFPNISLGTVYRNLSLLASLGEINKISCGDNSDHFDPNTEPHYHFYCRQCGCVQDIHLPTDPKLDQEAQKIFDGQIDAHSVCFYGICRSCTESEASAHQKTS